MVLWAVFRFGKRGILNILIKRTNISTVFQVGQTNFFRIIIPSPPHIVFSVTI